MPIFSLVTFQVIGLFALTVLGYLWLAQIGKRNLFPFLFLFLIALSVHTFLGVEKKPPETMNAEVKAQILLDQPLFADWYTAYKKDIDRIDANWQQYHKTLKLFINDEISIETVQLRLTEVQKNTRGMKEKFERMKPPEKLSQSNAALTDLIIHKTKNFSSQQDAILLSMLHAISANDFKAIPHDEQVSRLERIMILENPASLDIAADVLQIRNNLTIRREE